jgi:hypothetical protein
LRDSDTILVANALISTSQSVANDTHCLLRPFPIVILNPVFPMTSVETRQDPDHQRRSPSFDRCARIESSLDYSVSIGVRGYEVQTMEVEFWATAGQEECCCVEKIHCTDEFVLDVNDDDSFLNIPA